MKKGDIIEFGNYPQEVEEHKISLLEMLKRMIYGRPSNKQPSKKQPIKWIVLEANENEALLISLYGLDCKEYDNLKDPNDITWENCDLRKWLHDDFLKYAFSEEEIKRIKFSELKNDDNPECDTKGGNDTTDRIFCLSINEVEQYFSSDDARKCKPTAYAVKQHAFVEDGYCDWMLRSPGMTNFHVAMYNVDETCPYGSVVDNPNTIRPALRIFCNQ